MVIGEFVVDALVVDVDVLSVVVVVIVVDTGDVISVVEEEDGEVDEGVERYVVSEDEVEVVVVEGIVMVCADNLEATLSSASEGEERLDWGAHTAEILAEEGYDQDTIQRLLLEKVAQQADSQPKL